MVKAASILGIERVCRILGSDRVYDAEFASAIWHIPVYKNFPTRYTNDTLLRAAEQNRVGSNDWHLGFSFCLPMARQYEILHYSLDRKIKFQNAMPLLDDESGGWPREELTEFPRGLYLIDFKKRFLGRSWQHQEDAIKGYGEKFLRAPEEMVMEMVLNFQYMNGKRLMQNFMHWGTNESYNGCRVMVGENTRGSLIVDGYPEWQEDNKKLGVCVIRKWDF